MLGVGSGIAATTLPITRYEKRSRRAGASLGPFILLILAGVFFLGGHPYPAGTLAFGSFFVGALWLEFAPGRLTSTSRPVRT